MAIRLCGSGPCRRENMGGGWGNEHHLVVRRYESSWATSDTDSGPKRCGAIERRKQEGNFEEPLHSINPCEASSVADKKHCNRLPRMVYATVFSPKNRSGRWCFGAIPARNELRVSGRVVESWICGTSESRQGFDTCQMGNFSFRQPARIRGVAGCVKFRPRQLVYIRVSVPRLRRSH